MRNSNTLTAHEVLQRFKRLNLGTNAASEILHRKMKEILGNLPICKAMYRTVWLP